MVQVVPGAGGARDAAREFVLREFSSKCCELGALPGIENPKGELQERLQAKSPLAPEYEFIAATGPDHNRVFECGVKHAGAELARGTGKSSLVKAVHAAVNARAKGKAPLALIEIHREDIPSLPRLLALLRTSKRRCVLFCDDLSFEGEDVGYKALKAVLEGGIEGRPENTILYATSNRRHILSRNMIENEQSTAIHGGEAVEEKVSLSDRFGLWLGFHHLDQDTFFAIVDGYAAAFKLPIAKDDLRAKAIEWSMTRGARSGRVAWQFIQQLAGDLGVKIRLEA